MSDDTMTFVNDDMPLDAFPIMEGIRRQGKLCDVTLKVLIMILFSFPSDKSDLEVPSYSK